LGSISTDKLSAPTMAMAGAPRTYTSQNKCIKTTLIIILSQIVMKTLIKFNNKNSNKAIIL